MNFHMKSGCFFCHAYTGTTAAMGISKGRNVGKLWY